MTKYEKLTCDLTIAVEKAKEKAYLTNDGGTCNFDSCLLFLPNANEKKVCECATKAGIRVFKDRAFGKPCFFLSVPIASQGNRRTEQAEVMQKMLANNGYETTMWYQMD